MAAKIALVTGGSRGLGKDMALSLAKKGIDVLLTYNSNKIEAEKVVLEIQKVGQKSHALQFDVSDIKSLDSFIKRVHTILTEHWETEKFDFLINNTQV